ncbi:hypothetical protein A2973_05315 [Candidatus Gottesmanbacteria bacterium RIFCSPLOWO2_01_FULL_49_10]|uniref:Non-canonical purine NTP pyrophosphatase n=1 Tax=Candidatus Gottesmanbacteria bacterium RIFCSPLOWO2_01_FULL_49_10 TaxID=1798396 RepID=A0A1F6AZR6_9BACT|nr:MAG: hypothetical protein A2973_05315 [Candidatus Gottesmanbacteria bacterium RIFCSPLOWO2_01_FULL_49_10]
MKLLIATTNPGKLIEIRRFLGDLPVELIGLKDVGIIDIVEETGKTFEENAILKAKYYCHKSGLPTLADDGGAEIDVLGGEPGVKTRRWIHKNRDSTDEELIVYTLKRLEGVPSKKRGMQMRVVLAFASPDGRIHTATEKIRGVVALKPSNDRLEGFPFRSIMYLPEVGKFYNHDVLTPEENERLNHRIRALEQLKPIIRQSLT